MSLSIIVVTDIHGGIGVDGKLPFHVPEDLKRFKELTANHTIIMGRKTFESLPKVLPNRHHIVITKNYKYNKPSEDVSIMCNLNEAWMKLFRDDDKEYFVIGGGEIYKQFLPYCNKIYKTMVYTNVNADTFFEWTDDNSKEFYFHKITDKLLSKSGLEYRFIDLHRVNKYN